MRARTASVSLGAALAVAGACGPVAAPPRPAPPVNTCPDTDCRTYVDQSPLPTCEQGSCEVKQQLDYVLVVSLPVTSLFAPGHTFAVRSADFFARATPKCRPRSCVVLPSLASVDGAYLVNQAGATLLRRTLGNGALNTSLPVRVSMRPLWTPPGAGAAIDALAAGLPLDFVYGTMRNIQRAPPAPGGAPSIEYHVSVPVGAYERAVTPLEPFDDSFPPHVAEVIAPTSGYHEVLLVTETTTVDTFTFPISRDGGSLEGFTAELVDASTGTRVSTLARLSATSTAAVVRVLRQQGARARRLDLLLSPPPPLREAEALPELRYDFVAGTTPPILYPALPPPVVVEGTVGGRAREDEPPSPVTSTLELASVEIDTAATPGSSDKPRLRFVRRVRTDGQGRYSVRLPPGRYQITATPDAPGRWAKIAADDARIAAEPAVQRGRLVALGPAVEVRGRCRLADGRALAGARVLARPASVLAQPAQGEAAPAVVSRAMWPREASTETDADGAFTLALDSGRYDVTIAPAPGTRYPWLVVTSRFVGQEPIDLGALVVPAPVNASLRVHDANDNPILGAVVRAYAAPREGTVAVEIGRAMTDNEGRFDMDLAGYPK